MRTVKYHWRWNPIQLQKSDQFAAQIVQRSCPHCWTKHCYVPVRMELCSTAQEFKQTAEIKLLGLFVEMGAEALSIVKHQTVLLWMQECLLEYYHQANTIWCHCSSISCYSSFCWSGLSLALCNAFGFPSSTSQLRQICKATMSRETANIYWWCLL